MINLKEALKLLSKVKSESPLIHSITNPISINNCANMVLATGAKPIMAEHPGEVAEITKSSKALALNLGNITDVRMESMEIASKVAYENGIPFVLDLVGIASSDLRLKYAKKLIEDFPPSVLKGNMSEIKALLGLESSPLGIDVGFKDEIQTSNLMDSVNIGLRLSKSTSSTVVISGKYDIISKSETSYIVKNGNPMLTNITGSGCMLNVLIASYLYEDCIIEASLLATLVLTIASELATNYKGPASFLNELIDNVYNMKEETILERNKIDIFEVKNE